MAVWSARPIGLSGERDGFQKYLEIGALHHVVPVAIIKHGKARRHIRLERELLQEPRAQCVDGLHLQPARRLQRTGKQLTRRPSQARARMGDTDSAYRIIERGVAERDPVAERGEHALRHVGRGRLGEGDAEDLFRRHAVEQHPYHALDQHMRLARAGVRRHE